ncbi:FYVE zinc finger-domain-containing protein [Cytidiella melzeri]|nr:FYVE zinc finger-domain-containing protein [Cytidiella melzeri]
MSSFAAAVVSRLASLSPAHNDIHCLSSSQGTRHVPCHPGGHGCDSSRTTTPTVTNASDASSSSLATSFDARYCISDSPLSTSPIDSRTGAILQHGKDALRRNEHLAVLLHKSLWKPDSQASRCDIFLCSRKFSLFERRHHCRKCGGVFCAECSTRSTTLLDTSDLPFLNPPRGIPIANFASSESSVVCARVCDDCWDQIHGTKGRRSLLLHRKKLEEAEQWENESSSTGSSNSSPRTPHSSLEALPISPLARTPLRRANTSPRAQTLPTSTPPISSGSTCSAELDAYPLRHASVICKANGGGRWQPKPSVEVVGLRVPGTKAAYEIEMEREEEELRLLKLNPVVKNGDFQLWFPREVEPRSLAGPFKLSTF